MAETRKFPTAVIASLSSGNLLCAFSDMHEAAEYLMGHPIWTHQFADKQLVAEMRRAIAAQCPGLPMVPIDGLNASNYLDYVAKIEAEIGTHVIIRKGSGLTAMLPEDGIPEHLKSKTIFLKVKDD